MNVFFVFDDGSLSTPPLVTILGRHRAIDSAGKDSGTACARRPTRSSSGARMRQAES